MKWNKDYLILQQEGREREIKNQQDLPKRKTKAKMMCLNPTK